MSTYYVLIDNSTKGTGTSKYGESAVCWSVFADSIIGNPIRVGILYCNYSGPNKMFYVGVIRALEDCYFLGDHDCCLKIVGDCLPVINQLKGVWKVKALEPFYAQVKGLESKYRTNDKGLVSYDYLGEDNPLYIKVDKCVKDSFNYLRQRILNSEY
jgi:hypothetical protein